MRTIRSAERSEILAFVRAWVGVLAQGDFREALEWMDEESQSIGADTLRETIFSYSPNYRSARGNRRRELAPTIDDPATMDPTHETLHLYETERHLGERREVIVEYFLPLNGVWSPMRVTLSAYELTDGAFGFLLRDISVP